MVPPKYLSVTGTQVSPPSVVLKTPPPVVPIQYSAGRATEPAAAGEGEVALLTGILDESEGDVPRRPHLASIVCRHVQRAERAGGHGDRLPAHHMRPAAPAGPVEGGGVVSPLLPHHSDHLTGDLHGGLRSRLEDERAPRLQSGGDAAGE